MIAMTMTEMNESISTLTEYQRNQIAAQLQEYLQLNHELQDTTPQVCPRCGQHGAFIKKGFSGSKQRYQCKCCGKKFTYDAFQLTFWSHQSPDKWVTLIENTISLEPLKKVEEDLGGSHPTAQNTRHKLLVFLSANMENMPVLDEIIEADETFVLESRKGTRVLDREPRKHGEGAQSRGISSEQLCVCVAADRNTHITAKCVNTARPTSDDILSAIGNKIGTDSILLCDGNAAYNKLAAEKHCIKIELIGHVSYSKVYHLNTINGLHSKFKEMLRTYRGVASKYLNRYAAMFSTSASLSAFSIAEAGTKIRRMLKNVMIFAPIRILKTGYLTLV